MQLCAVSGTEIVHFTFKAYIYKTLYSMLQIVRLTFAPTMYKVLVFSVCGTDESFKSMQKYELLFQIHSWTRTSHSLLRDGIILDSSKGSAGSGLQVLNSDQS